jgi:hypothetical protein
MLGVCRHERTTLDKAELPAKAALSRGDTAAAS